MDEPSRHAYATLGLTPGTSARELKTRYKQLVRTWHPDRFASDPAGQAEAALRMSQINRAYRLLVSQRIRVPPPGPRPAATPPTAPPTNTPPTRLTREQIDGMIRSMRNEGPIEALFGFFGQYAGPREAIPVDWAHAPVIVAMLVFALVLIYVRTRFGRWAADGLFLLLIVGAIIFARWSRDRGF